MTLCLQQYLLTEIPTLGNPGLTWHNFGETFAGETKLESSNSSSTVMEQISQTKYAWLPQHQLNFKMFNTDYYSTKQPNCTSYLPEFIVQPSLEGHIN